MPPAVDPPGPSPCPQALRDDRKSAALAAEGLQVPPGARLVQSFASGREILRSPAMRQSIDLGAGLFRREAPSTTPVIFLDGEDHRRKRTAIARFFTPKWVETRYRGVMEQVTDALLRNLQDKGRARLDEISFELAVSVAAEIVGLTNSDRAAMARRIASSFSGGAGPPPAGLRKLAAGVVAAFRHLRVFHLDVRPAIRARRAERRDDVISQLLDQGASERAILIECLVYASAGMVTTREFIVMAAWHMFERDDLRRRFVEADEAWQFAILEEILRLEPVAGLVYRRAEEPHSGQATGPVPAGTRFVIDIRAANADETVAGACPHALDPDRKAPGALLSFGDGPHRCPGAQVALHETRIFLDRLMRVPGVALERAPEMSWNGALMSYELRNAVVTCSREAQAGGQ